MQGKSYVAWRNIKRRCLDPKHKSFENYGARGITLQASWVTDSKAFCRYVETLPSYHKDLTLERIDNDSGYCEGNLRWVSRKTQAENRRRMRNNTSGATAVAFHEVVRDGYTDTYVLARWVEPGRRSRTKTFNVRQLGLLPAYAMAVQYRGQQIAILNSSGAAYSGKHGL